MTYILINNDKINYNDILCEAVDTIVQKRLENVKYDNTVVAQIINAENAQYGHYIVQEGKITYDVLSDNKEYKVGDKVYVTIPGDNYNNTKIILSAYKNPDEIKTLTMVQPSDIYIKTQLPLSPENATTVININRASQFDGDIYYADEQAVELVIGAAQHHRLDSALAVKLLNLCTNLMLSADIQCYLNSSDNYTYSGEYGIALYLNLNYREGNRPSKDDLILLGNLSSKDFLGNPYNLLVPVKQHVILDTTALNIPNQEDSSVSFILVPYCSTKFEQYNLITNQSSTIGTVDNDVNNTIKLSGVSIPDNLLNSISNKFIENSHSIIFNNLSITLGFNAKNKNHVLELYEMILNKEFSKQERIILPIWYNIDEQTGEEIRFNDNNPITYNQLREYMRDPLGLAEIAPSHFEKDFYDVYIDFFNIGAPYRNSIQVDMREYLNEQLNIDLDTKESLYIYAHGIQLDSRLSTMCDNLLSIGQRFANLQPMTLLQNEASPISINNYNNSIEDADCQIVFNAANVNENTFIQGISLQSDSAIKANYCLITLKYLKDLLIFQGFNTTNSNLFSSIISYCGEDEVVKWESDQEEGQSLHNLAFKENDNYGYLYIMIRTTDTDSTISFDNSKLLELKFYMPELPNGMQGSMPVMVAGPVAEAQTNNITNLSTEALLNLSDNNIIDVWPKENGQIIPYSRAFNIFTMGQIYGEDFVRLSGESISPIFDSNFIQDIVPSNYPTVLVRQNNGSTCYALDEDQAYILSDEPNTLHHIVFNAYCYSGSEISLNLIAKINQYHSITYKLLSSDGTVHYTNTIVTDTLNLREVTNNIKFPIVNESADYLVDITFTQNENMTFDGELPWLKVRNFQIRNLLYTIEPDFSLTIGTPFFTEEGIPFKLYKDFGQEVQSMLKTIIIDEADQIDNYFQFSLPAREINFLQFDSLPLVPNARLNWSLYNDNPFITSCLYVDGILYIDDFCNWSNSLIMPKVKLVLINTSVETQTVQIALPALSMQEENVIIDEPDNLPPRGSNADINQFMQFALSHIQPLIKCGDNKKVYYYKDTYGNNTNLRAVFPQIPINDNQVGLRSWGYVYGTSGKTNYDSSNESYYWKQHYKSDPCYKNNYSLYRKHISQWIGKTVCDCQGLCDAFLNTEINANTNYEVYCNKGANVSEFKLGDAVFKLNKSKKAIHVGWICGYLVDTNNKVCDYLVVEAKGLRYGVLVTRYSKSSWHKHCRMSNRFTEGDNLPMKGTTIQTLPSDGSSLPVGDINSMPDPITQPTIPVNYTYATGTITELPISDNDINIAITLWSTYFPTGFYLVKTVDVDYWNDLSPSDYPWGTDSDNPTAVTIKNWLKQLDSDVRNNRITTSNSLNIIFKNLKEIVEHEFVQADLRTLLSETPWHNLFKANFYELLSLKSELIVKDEIFPFETAFLILIAHLIELYNSGYMVALNAAQQYKKIEDNDIYAGLLDMYFPEEGLLALESSLGDIKNSLEDCNIHYQETQKLINILLKNKETQNDFINLWKVIQSLTNIDSPIGRDYEREKNRFLKFSKNRYDFYLYFYDTANSNIDTVYLLDQNWHYNQEININNILQPQTDDTELNGSLNNSTLLKVLNKVDVTKDIRAILIYNHQLYYSNIIKAQKEERK